MKAAEEAGVVSETRVRIGELVEAKQGIVVARILGRELGS